MMRASMGKAVMDMLAPMKRTACQGVTVAAKRAPSPWSHTASRPPRAKGVTMPARETLAALRTRRLIKETSKSSPTVNM
jgi:hypothetical protein